MKKTILLFLVAFVFGIASEASAKVVTVQKGDSMWLISKRYNVPFSEVLRLNKQHHVDVNMIHPNDKIYLPDGSAGASTTESHQAPPQAVTTQAEAVLLLVNNERRKQGLSELKLSNSLTSIATMKSKDMAEKGYFDHNSPTYGSPFDMLHNFGISYRAAGENIAAGQKTANEVMNSWMNSSGHRANILNTSYTELGVGYYVGGQYGVYWTQLFVKE